MLLFKSLKHKLWMLMGSNKYSFIFLKIYCFFRNKELGPVTVSHKTDIVIEGYPRSGNTFAYMSFKNTQNKEN